MFHVGRDSGAGDIATGIALRLWRAGMQVVMTDIPGTHCHSADGVFFPGPWSTGRRKWRAYRPAVRRGRSRRRIC